MWLSCLPIRLYGIILEEERKAHLKVLLKDVNFAGKGFTDNFFILPKEVLPFFKQFNLEKLHVLNCESFLYLQESALLEQPPEVVAAWLDLAEPGRTYHVHREESYRK